MFREIKYNEDLDIVLDQIRKGAFLTVKSGDKLNTMTIGWATFGIIWNKPILMVLVRKSRHTHEIIENASDFTVSVPVNKDLKKALSFCGSYSGRDIDKIKEAKLTTKKAVSVDTPIIKECNYHYECKILFKLHMNEENLHEDIVKSSYPIGDYHTLYFGQILKSYKTD